MTYEFLQIRTSENNMQPKRKKKYTEQRTVEEGIVILFTIRTRKKDVINTGVKTCKELCFSEEDEELLFTFDYRRR